MTSGDRLEPAEPAGHDDGGAGRRYRGRDAWLGGVLVFAVFLTLVEARLWRPDTRFWIEHNVQIGEAQAWWSGRLDLPERQWDTALKDGRVYSYFPPMFTIIAAGVVPFFDGVPHWFIVALIATVPLCAYLLLYRLTHSPVWGALLTIGYVCGTSVWPVVNEAVRGAAPYHVNHALASFGLLLILIDCLGARRIWPAAIGLILAAWSRQLTVVYALPIAYAALRHGPAGARWKRLAEVAAACMVLVGVYCGLNTLKFDHPLRTGYMLNHEQRSDRFAREAREYGLLSTHWVPRNLYYANVGFPKVDRITSDGQERVYLRPNTMGTGIWWTTPLLLCIFFDLKRVARDRSALMWLAAAGLLYGMLMFWHATGEVQRGYNRYSLDYIPVIFALVAPRCIEGWRRWVTLGMIAWSVVYFRFILAMPRVEVWSS